MFAVDCRTLQLSFVGLGNLRHNIFFYFCKLILNSQQISLSSQRNQLDFLPNQLRTAEASLA
jgi:hypothetical protein